MGVKLREREGKRARKRAIIGAKWRKRKARADAFFTNL